MSKICLVTGGTSGIGLSVAQKLIDDNNIVIICDEKGIDENFLKANFKMCQNIHYFKCNISNSDDIKALKLYISEKFRKLDCMVCSAGIMPLPCGIDDITDFNIDRTIDVNLKGTFRCLREFGSIIKETSSHGSIVTITSVDGIIGEPYGAIYSATKAGIISMTKSFARHFGETLRVNAVAPGLIDTPLTLTTGENPKDTIDFSIIKRIGKPDEVANAIEFLLSEKASYITGQVLTVDGGFTLK